MKYAVIDIGSNSVRLMISADGVTLYKLVETTRLSEGLDGSGALLEQPMLRTASAVAGFVRHAREKEGVTPVIFATEAVRSGKNRDTFLQMVADDTGIAVDVINGETEAEIGFMGAVNGEAGKCAVLDVGGASAELSVGENGTLLSAKSVPVGVVRIHNHCSGRESAERLIVEKIAELPAIGKIPKLIGIGGTITNLAAAGKGVIPYDPQKVHGAELTFSEICELEDRLYQSSIAERVALGIDPKRADLITGGATLVRMILQRYGVSVLRASESDNLEGYLHRYLQKA